MSVLSNSLRQRITKDFGPNAVLARPINDSPAFAYTSPDAMMVEGSANDAEMSIDFVVVTDDVDREGDIITPQGCREYLEEYLANPVWLLEHNAVEPIGLCRDKSGRFQLNVTEHKIFAKNFYNRLSLRGERLSEEIYLLTKSGVFAGASPGFLPIKARKRGYGKDDGYNYLEWRLTELSQTCQPVNQLALRASLSRGIVKSMGLKTRLESLLIKPNPVVIGGFEGKSMSKPKTAAIEFEKDIFATETACVAWINAHGLDSSSCEPLPTSFIFKQRDGKPNAGKKSLGKGVTALLTKAFGKEKADDDEDEKKKKKDEKPNDMADEKVEKADESPDDEDEDDEIDDVEDSDAEGDEDGDEGEESEGETGAEDETEYDPAALKKEADNLVDMIAHFELACEHAERMKGESVKSPELFDKLHADAQALVKDLRAAYKDGFADQAMEDAINERKQGAAEQEQIPAENADAAPDEYKEMAKALRAARKSLDEANSTAKALPRLAVA